VFSRRRELWYAGAAIIAVTALYAVAGLQAGAFPAASGLVGHGIGIVGFVLMLMTETLYSIRKQSARADLGSMVSWLRFHIFTGLVGPYMVLLHTAMHFSGLAGVAMLLTAVVVASGVVGRYLYTATPRQLSLEPSTPAQAEKLAARRSALATWYSLHVPLTWVLFAIALAHAAAALYYATLQR
jgi:cytochrome b561